MKRIIVLSLILFIFNLLDLGFTYINMTYNGVDEANIIAKYIIEQSWILFGVIKFLLPILAGILFIWGVNKYPHKYKFSYYSLYFLTLCYMIPVVWNIGLFFILKG